MKLTNTKILKNIFAIRSTLSEYHPLLIEGHTRDDRDPQLVASRIINNLEIHWNARNISKPIMLISQGDPLTEKGISAITRAVADELNIKRCLVTLDDHIDPDHSKLADRHEVLYEILYSQLIEILQVHYQEEDMVNELTQSIDCKISYKNEKRRQIGKDELQNWYKTYALLQEVSKSALKVIAGEVTIAHVTDNIEEFSVTSFYEVGLELGLIESTDMVQYHA